MPLKERDCAATYKVLVLGDSSVGKTAILHRLRGDEFRESTVPTAGADFVTKIFEVDGALVQLIIWDSAGDTRFRSITRQQFKGTQGIILMYDVTRPYTLEFLQFWVSLVQNEIHHSHSKYEPIPIVLLGNKADLEDQRKVDVKEGEKLVGDQVAFEFFETSAKSGHNVFQAFRRLAYHITDICDPKVMKSYHPHLIRISESTEKEQNDRKRKRKSKKRKKKSGRSKLGGLFTSCVCASSRKN